MIISVPFHLKSSDKLIKNYKYIGNYSSSSIFFAFLRHLPVVVRQYLLQQGKKKSRNYEAGR